VPSDPEMTGIPTIGLGLGVFTVYRFFMGIIVARFGLWAFDRMVWTEYGVPKTADPLTSHKLLGFSYARVARLALMDEGVPRTIPPRAIFRSATG